MNTKENGSTFLLVIYSVGAMLTIGSLSLNLAVNASRQVSSERSSRESYYLAEAGLRQGAATLKLDEADGFNDNELTSSYPLEAVPIGEYSYSIHQWIDTSSMGYKKKYKVWLTDNDDSDFSGGASNDTIVEDDYDEDNAVILISKGWVEDDDSNVLSSSILKGLYKLVAYPHEYAILAQGDLYLQGNVTVIGSKPSIHVNGNITSVGNSDETEGAVTASGTVTGDVNLPGGGSTGIGGSSNKYLPSFSADYYKSLAHDLAWDMDANPVADGDCVQAPTGGSDCVEICNSGGSYTVSSPSPGGGAVCQTPAINAGGVFYFNGSVVIDTSNEWSAVVLSTGSITLTTNTEIIGSADLPGVALVADGNITLSGTVDVGSAANQLGLYAGLGFIFSGGGNKTIYGPLMAYEAASFTSLVGNITIVYDNSSPPANGPPTGQLISWVQIE